METPKQPSELTEAVVAVIEVLSAILVAISKAPQKSIPSGELYAILMGKMTLETYNNLVNFMVLKKYVTVKNHLITLAPEGNIIVDAAAIQKESKE